MAGRVVSKKNEHRLRAIMAEVEEILGQLPSADDETDKPETKAAKAKVAKTTEALIDVAEAVLRQSDSVDGRRELIRQAVKEFHRDPMKPDGYVYCYVRDLFPEAAVYEFEGALYQVAYTIDRTQGAAKAIVGQPIQVEVTYSPVAVVATESAQDLAEDFDVALVEKAVRADGTVPIKIISPGWGSSGYYPADVLERDGPKVFTEGLKMYANHPTPREEAERPERAIEDIVAVMAEGAKWQANGPEGPGLYTSAKVIDTWRADVEALAETIGVSIRAQGKVRMGEAEGRKGPIVEALVGAKSVDFVTDPGRGGKILSLREAATKRQADTKPQPTPNGKEGAMPLTEAEAKALQESVANLQKEQADLKAENARLQEANTLREATEFVAASLPANLPALTRARLLESLPATYQVKDGVIDKAAFATKVQEAVKAEVDYLAKVTGSGVIKNLGTSFEESRTEPKPEEVTASLAESFKSLGWSDEAAGIAAKGR